MMRIALPLLALSMLGAPIIGAALADQAGETRPAINRLAADGYVSISRDQAIDIAEEQGVTEVEHVTLSNGAWRVEGETYEGRVVQVGVSAQTGGVHVLDHGPSA